MPDSFVDQHWPIDGGHVRVIVVRDQPIPAQFYASMQTIVESAEALAATLPPAQLSAEEEVIARWKASDEMDREIEATPQET